MAGKVFINYRRRQSLAEAQYLATVLEKDFKGRVFIDVRGIDGFSDWFEMLKQQVAGSAALISIIGKDWLVPLDRKDHPSGEAPKDCVRFEIAEALQRHVPVLPVLLDGAAMPKADELPADLQELPRRQAMDLNAKRFPEEAAAISKQVKKILAETQRGNGNTPLRLAVFSVVMLAAVAMFGSYLMPQARLPSPPVPSYGSQAVPPYDLQTVKNYSAALEPILGDWRGEYTCHDGSGAREGTSALKVTRDEKGNLAASEEFARGWLSGVSHHEITAQPGDRYKFMSRVTTFPSFSYQIKALYDAQTKTLAGQYVGHPNCDRVTWRRE